MKRSLMKGSTYVNVNCFNNNNNNQMATEFWECNNNNSHTHNHTNADQDYVNGFPWPPRSYTCSFCRKEFKSAQALGGHMNVHRRDRARLRHSPPGPMLNLNLDPTTTTTATTYTNPNNSTSSLSLLPSSTSSSSSPTHKKPVTCTLPLFVSPTPPSPSPELKRWDVVDGIVLNPFTTKSTSDPTKSKVPESFSAGVGEYHDHAFAMEEGCKMLKKSEMLRMDLEIGLPRDYDLDLELRLGTTYS